MRGEDFNTRQNYRFECGITPACAGKTSSPQAPPEGSSGSPPHARGRHVLFGDRQNSARITPACAGKTLRSSYNHGMMADHPRMRGEDYISKVKVGRFFGSPPHARGRRFPCVRVDKVLGITPACAGKTLDTIPRRTGGGDHPRMRGEDSWFSRPLSLPKRITPACAGKTVRVIKGDVSGADHPRMRGEDKKQP